jgi:hypothetical protein
VVFCSATFGAGVVATQRPITCPKRQLQPERYVPFAMLGKTGLDKNIVKLHNYIKGGKI